MDAGYYDNYGVNLAAAWAYQYRDWIRNNTSGLALIQIYAYPRTGTSDALIGSFVFSASKDSHAAPEFL